MENEIQKMNQSPMKLPHQSLKHIFARPKNIPTVLVAVFLLSVVLVARESHEKDVALLDVSSGHVPLFISIIPRGYNREGFH